MRIYKKIGPEFIEGIHLMLLRTQAENVTHVLVDLISLKKKIQKQKAGTLSQKDFLRDLRPILFLMPI
ncbi:MAG: hypothetical protein RBS85_04555 [Methanofastidiosum sp.]|nr:hypothetical protein [Methanofastidiosum sp.]